MIVMGRLILGLWFMDLTIRMRLEAVSYTHLNENNSFISIFNSRAKAGSNEIRIYGNAVSAQRISVNLGACLLYTSRCV